VTLRRRRIGHEAGDTLIEVVVATLVLVVIIGAVVGMMLTNDKSTLGNQRQTQLIAVLQQRIEYVHQVLAQNYSSLGFAAIALSSNPAQGTDVTTPSNPTDPNDFITPYVSNFATSTSSTAEKFLIESNYNKISEGTIDGGTTYSEELQVDSTNGKIAPVVYVDISTGTVYTSLSSVPTGDPYATVYTYVTQAVTGVSTTLSSCSTGTAGSTTGDARRIIVAAKMYTPTTGTVQRADNIGSKYPQYSTTLMTDPIPANTCQGASGLRIGLNIG
jgi:type II secretory pathway pseudopilin PulG